MTDERAGFATMTIEQGAALRDAIDPRDVTTRINFDHFWGDECTTGVRSVDVFLTRDASDEMLRRLMRLRAPNGATYSVNVDMYYAQGDDEFWGDRFSRGIERFYLRVRIGMRAEGKAKLKHKEESA